ncbi:MaoC family dehydratase [Amycolatopsis sp. NPDC006131]|uniref:MaoC family dehydratase n=1 Tax=Amycolatopsis sp. NPDC006131 TaxID=3156731 RepID=UPI0033A00DB6
MMVIHGVDDLLGRAGQELGVSPWFPLTQDDVDVFAEVTRDHQWLHVDTDRAKGSVFGGTIAHGFLTLSLITHLHHEVFEMRDYTHGLNYGMDRVRFPAPARVGSSVRARVTVAEAQDRGDAVQATFHTVIENDATDKPVCVVDFLVRYYGPRLHPRSREA